MVSIGNLTPKQAAVSSGHGIGFVVRTISSMVSKLYNGLRTWGSGASRTQLQLLSRPSSVTRNPAGPIDSLAKRASTMNAASNARQNTAEQNFTNRAATDREKTMRILSEVRKGGPAKLVSSQSSNGAGSVKLLSL